MRWLFLGGVAAVLAVASGYPIDTLRCCNTLARPDNLDQCMNKIGRGAICAQERNLVCVLEKIDKFTESMCGKDDHTDFGTWQNYQPNDGTFSTFPTWPYRWDAVNEECVYRKCDEQCPDGNNDPGAQRTGRNEFEYEGAIYKRQWWCCNDRALCNGAQSTVGFSVVMVAAVVSALAVFLAVT